MPDVLRPFAATRRVYCAGPLFNAAERAEMLQIARVLTEGGYEPFVPHADGMEFAQLHPWLTAAGHDAATIGEVLHHAVFALDAYQVVLGCASLVLNMNGRVPDEGAVAESAMAWAFGKPIVIYKDDARSKIAGRDNPMIVGQTGFRTVDRMQDLADALAARWAELRPDPERQVACPPGLAQPLAAGEALWRRLCELGAERPAEQVSEIVLELFAPTGAPR